MAYDNNRWNGGKQNYSNRPSYNPIELKNTDEYYRRIRTQGYFTDADKKKMDADFIIRFAKDIAYNLDTEGAGKKNKRTQIRKYYDYLLRVMQKLQRCSMDYSFIEADAADLLPKVNYAKTRDVVTDCFVQFIDVNISLIKDADDFKAFLKHFEAIVAYMKKDTK